MLADALAARAQPLEPAGIEYATLREAERALGFDVALPSRLPDELQWPPTTVRGEHGAHPAVSILLLSADGSRSLLIRQSLGAETAPPPDPAADAVDINGAEGRLAVSRGSRGQPISRLVWSAGGRVHEISGTYAGDVLAEVARSIQTR
jgi:hypothetical protein